MVLSKALNDREQDKFVEVNGLTCVRVTAENFSGTFSPSGLQNAGRFTEVELVDFEWRPLPVTAQTDRNGIVIQNLDPDLNTTNVAIKLNFIDSVGYVGEYLPFGNERFYDIKDSILIYGRTSSGTIKVGVTEVS